MGLEELAIYLQRDLREVQKMASRGYIPGQKVSGEWRFHQVEINQWLETQMHAYTEQELSRLESAAAREDASKLLVTGMLSEATMAVPLPAMTRTSVLKELVQLAEQSWLLYDPEAILNAIRQREEMASTALPGGIAIPHPHRPLPNALGDDVVAFGRTVSGLPFGGAYSGLTDLYFLVLCRDYSKHLRVLARLSRMFLRPNFIHDLRTADSSRAVLELIEKTEGELVHH
jgi:PTS system nitrogen regulatory IIA component